MECQAEEAPCRADARHGGDEGTAVKKMVTPAVKREAVAHLKAHLALSERRACEIAGADRKRVRYQSQPAPDTALRGRLRDLANERRRFGYRRLFVLPLSLLGYALQRPEPHSAVADADLAGVL